MYLYFKESAETYLYIGELLFAKLNSNIRKTSCFFFLKETIVKSGFCFSFFMLSFFSKTLFKNFSPQKIKRWLKNVWILYNLFNPIEAAVLFEVFFSKFFHSFTPKPNVINLQVGFKQSNKSLDAHSSDDVSKAERKEYYKKSKHWEGLIMCIGFEDGDQEGNQELT